MKLGFGRESTHKHMTQGMAAENHKNRKPTYVSSKRCMVPRDVKKNNNHFKILPERHLFLLEE